MSRSGGILTLLSGGFTAEAKVLFAAMTVQPNGARKTLINKTIRRLKASGAWALMDVFYMMAAHDEQAGRLNWKAPGSFTLANIGGGSAFTVDRGFKGNGTSTAQDTTYNPATAPGAQFLQNSAHMGCVPTENFQSDSRCVGHLRAAILPRSSSSVASCNGMSSSGDTIQTGQTNSQQVYTWYRNNAADFRTFINGANQLNPVRVSSAVSNFSWIIGGRNDTVMNFSATQLGCFHAGGALTDQQVADLYTAIFGYMNPIGAL